MNLYKYDKTTLEKIQSLPQGFYISYDSQKRVVLSIKSMSGLITTLVKGCPINLLLSKSDKLTTLYIIDNPINPQYFKGKGFSSHDTEYQNYESIVIDLIKSTEFKLIILNESNYQIANLNIKKENSINLFNNWLSDVEDEFELQISNMSFIDEKKIIYIDSEKNEIWNGNLINNKSYFNFDEYLKDGMHGYHQEFSIRNLLSQFYNPNTELFPSIQKTNGEELTDFLILYKKAVVIIESKYTISPKQTKFTSAISKAIEQLNKVEYIVRENPKIINHEFIKKEIIDFQVILKLCLFYDDGRDLKKAFKNFYEKYDINYLPIFVSIDVMAQFMSYLKILNGSNYKYNIIENLLKVRMEYRKKNKIIIIDGFDNITGAVTFTY